MEKLIIFDSEDHTGQWHTMAPLTPAERLTEQIILEVNEDSQGELEKKDMAIDFCEEEREVLEEVGDMTDKGKYI
jgi:hypothetical protein